MLTARNRMLVRQFFEADQGNPGGGGAKSDPPVDDKDGKNPPAELTLDDRSSWTPEQWQAEIQRIATKEKAEGRKAAEREYQQKQDEAAAEADLQKQEAEGKYEEAKGQLTKERDAAVADRDRALELLKADIDTRWEGMPDSVKGTYSGEEDDVLAKSAFMQQMKPIIDELESKAEKENERSNPGNTKGPKPTDKATTSQEDEAAKRTVRPRL